MNKILSISILLISTLFGQLKVTSVEKIPITTDEQWSNPIFSPNGKEIFYTNTEYNGIWQYSIASKLVKVITTDKTSGYNFVISDDGQKIAYRRTTSAEGQLTRIQEVVEIDLQSLSKKVVDKGNAISTPVFDKNRVTTVEGISEQKNTTVPLNDQVTVLGIEDTKIALLQNGAKIIFDPLNGGRYIWPKLSPDGLNIVAVDMERGAFISDLNGRNIFKIGKCNAPQWLRSGNWIIGMDDRDDGHRIIGSDIIAISKDGKTRIRLTDTVTMMEMFPAVSPVENKIVVSTAAGELLLMAYEEIQ
jgi:Tol biopolymer transport system component